MHDHSACCENTLIQSSILRPELTCLQRKGSSSIKTVGTHIPALLASRALREPLAAAVLGLPAAFLNRLILLISRIQQEVPSLEVLEQEMAWMKEHLSQLGSPIVLCHNDLLCKNIIHNDKEGKGPHTRSLTELYYIIIHSWLA